MKESYKLKGIKGDKLFTTLCIIFDTLVIILIVIIVYGILNI